MKTAVVLGSNSDIMKAIMPMMEADYSLRKWSRGAKLSPEGKWDLCVIALGKVAPVGLWHDVHVYHWQDTIYCNLTYPFELLQKVWPEHNPGATVIWLAGSNPNSILSGYSAYCASKIAVNKLVEQMDAETPDCKFIALGPGICLTKIHGATAEANWPNPRLERAIEDGSFTKMEHIYSCMKWCIAQDKSVVGGRNICVSDMDYRYGNLIWNLQHNESMFKLRRNEGRTV